MQIVSFLNLVLPTTKHTGKSTQVPAILLDGLASPDNSNAAIDGSISKGYILCTQPRRLAVCAVAERVAEERNVKLGGTEVGYHIGQKNLSSKKTRLLFTTAGILLEELRDNGMEALTKFATIIIDECHERSSESDLVLAICKSFMRAHPTAPIRIVLMSATFDHARLRRILPTYLVVRPLRASHWRRHRHLLRCTIVFEFITSKTQSPCCQTSKTMDSFYGR